VTAPAVVDGTTEDPDIQEYTGGMVALVPAPGYLQDLAVDGGIPLGELHLTLAYLGDDVTSWPQAQRDAVLGRVRLAARGTEGLVMARVFGHAVFNPDGGPDGDQTPCLVYLVGESRVLDRVQQSVAVGLAGMDGIPPQRRPNFPHITATEADAVLTYTGPVVFDRVRVAFGGEVTDIPLTGGTSPDSPMTADSAPNPVYVDVRAVSRDPGDLAAFAQLCQTIARCCSAGASRDITVFVDGDGSADLRFDFGDSDVSGVPQLDIDGDLTIGIGG
jgi:hypothetical protein